MKEDALQDTWYGGRRPGLLLTALERVYAGVSAARRSRARPNEALQDRAIVVVGNITAGGTGKTPLVIRLCELCREAGVPVAVVSRGYGRTSNGPVQVHGHTAADQGGDEPVLIARRVSVSVFVDADREAAAEAAFADGAQLVLADDGLQRLSLPRKIELCVVDAARGFGNGRLLPAGPLREPLARLSTVDWVVSNGDAAGIDFPEGLKHSVVPMRLEAEGFRNIDSGLALRPDEALERFADQALTAVAGMGHPERFFTTLEGLGLEQFERLPFPDHHHFSEKDFEAVDGPVLMTEKDAVKCEGLGLADAWSLAVSARLPSEWEAEFMKRVADII